MPYGDWRAFIKKELYEDKFPLPFAVSDVQHNYRVDSRVDIREGMLVINACFLRFLEYRRSGIVFKQPDGFLGTLLKLPLRDIDDLRCGEGEEKASLYLFLRSVPSSHRRHCLESSSFRCHLVYIRIPGRYGMRFHFKTESDQEITLNQIRSSQETYEKWLHSTDPTVLGKQCPKCSSTLLIPTTIEDRFIVECGHCGGKYSPEQLKETR
jgi:hypothetical protein